jgi:hypothetical protein
MACDEFLYIIRNHKPQDIVQAERVIMICHLKECESCAKLIGEQIAKGVDNDDEMKRLAAMDREVVT